MPTPLLLLPLFAVGAFLALGGGLWDDAWHTERGRDSFFIAPHLAIYGGVTIVGGSLSLWLLFAARAAGVRAALRDPVLVLAGMSVAVTLGSAPVDNFWHEAFGRDAVIWSPPHVLGIVGTGTLGVALLVEMARSDRAWGRRVTGPVGGLVLAAFAFLVVEYETDVPQFAPVWYLPVLALGAGFALAVLDRLRRDRWAVTRAAAWHLIFVGLVSLFLLAAGLHAPRLPLLLGVALALDASRAARPWLRAGVAAVALFALYAPVSHLGNGMDLGAGDIVVGLPLAWAALLASLLLVGGGRRAWSVPHWAPFAAALLVVLLLAPPGLAHDPGQGPDAGTIPLSIRVQDGRAAVAAAPPAGWRPRRLVARRAGAARYASFAAVAGRARGSVRLDATGRWFVYADFVRPDGATVESWLPVDNRDATVVRSPERFAYVVDRKPADTLKYVLGGLLYAVMLGFLVAVLRLVRRTTPRTSS